MVRRRKPRNQSSSNTTADHLARAVYDNAPPEHPQTCEDFGFNRAVGLEENRFLLGLYAGLIKNQNISPRTIHEWRVRGVLVDEIKAAFNKIPEDSRGLYFPWFLQNQHIVASAGKPLSDEEMRDHSDAVMLHAWHFTGGTEKDSADEIRAIIASKPVEQIMCYTLYTLLLSAWLPSSRFDIWIEFGFASCTSEAEESALYRGYQRLITMCTFHEFCDAHRNRCLLDLFHTKGVQVNVNAQLQALLSGDIKGARKSVWVLKKFVLHGAFSGEEFSDILSLILDYGFINCRNPDEWQQLEKVYKDFFIVERGDPVALYEACIEGNLYAFLSSMTLLHPKYRRLLAKRPWFHYPSRPSGAGRVSPLVLLLFGALVGGVLVMFWMKRSS